MSVPIRPPCKHDEYQVGCPACKEFYDDGIDGMMYRASLAARNSPKLALNVTNNPPIKPACRAPCIHEGKRFPACQVEDERTMVRYCDHPQAEWDICARQALPINPNWGKGMDCRQCPFYKARVVLIVP